MNSKQGYVKHKFILKLFYGIAKKSNYMRKPIQ